MARPRSEIGMILRNILGTNKVYFQQPSKEMINAATYIVYERSDFETTRADNKIYRGLVRYTITIISKDPDNDLFKKIMDSFMYCSYDRSFKSDNYNHDVLTLYY